MGKNNSKAASINALYQDYEKALQQARQTHSKGDTCSVITFI